MHLIYLLRRKTDPPWASSEPVVLLALTLLQRSPPLTLAPSLAVSGFQEGEFGTNTRAHSSTLLKQHQQSSSAKPGPRLWHLFRESCQRLEDAHLQNVDVCFKSSCLAFSRTDVGPAARITSLGLLSTRHLGFATFRSRSGSPFGSAIVCVVVI